jgi:hypothetical protein
MKSRKRTALLAGVLATLIMELDGLAPDFAYADEPTWQAVWQINAGSCVPDSRTAAAQIYMTATKGLRVKFVPGATGTIRLSCPISLSKAEDFPAATRIRNVLYFQDPDGRFDDYYVKGTFHTVWAGNGSISNDCSINSNDADSTAQWGQLSCDYFGGTAPGLRIYWLDVEIVANTTGRTVEFNGAAIWAIPE